MTTTDNFLVRTGHPQPLLSPISEIIEAAANIRVITSNWFDITRAVKTGHAGH